MFHRTITEASNWFLKSAAQGYSQAEANAGVAYATGRGVRLDYVQAYVWFSLAAEHGDSGSVRARQKLKEIMTPAQIEAVNFKLKTNRSRP